MIDWILSYSLLILVVIGTRAIFKDKISQRLRYALWVLVLIRLLIPVTIGHSVISTAICLLPFRPNSMLFLRKKWFRIKTEPLPLPRLP